MGEIELKDTESKETGGTDTENRADLEEMFAQLEEVIGQMENSGATLEESFELYDRGMKLLRKCVGTIDEVEKKVLVLDENGETDEF